MLLFHTLSSLAIIDAVATCIHTRMWISAVDVPSLERFVPKHLKLVATTSDSMYRVSQKKTEHCIIYAKYQISVNIAKCDMYMAFYI